MKALDRHIEFFQQVKKRREIISTQSRAKNRITEHARSERLKISEAFGLSAQWCFCKVEPFKLLREVWFETFLLCTAYHLLQQLAWTDIERIIFMIDEFTKKERHVIFPRDLAEGTQVNSRFSIRITCMPAGILSIIICYVACVPAENDIAETKIAVDYTEEFLSGNIFTAKYAVYICDGKFDFA